VGVPATASLSPRPRAVDRVPPHAYFVASAVFHYLGPAFAVLLFARVEPLGVAWLRIATAAAVFAAWRRPWRLPALRSRGWRRTVLALGAVLALMNASSYLAIDALPLGTVAAIEFAGPILLALLGRRSRRNLAALALAVAGVYLLTDVRLEGEPLGFLFAFANAALFTLYVVLAHRLSRSADAGGIDGLAAAMLAAFVFALPLGLVDAAPALVSPLLLAAAVGVGLCSSVVPYVFDQLAMARLPRATFALMIALLPASATVIGLVVLGQVPTAVEVAGVALVVAGVLLRRDPPPDGIIVAMPLAWETIAERAVGQLAPEERDASVVYVDERILPAGVAVELDGRSVELDRAVAVAFVDLEPRLNWGHRCRYLLVDAETGAVDAVEARMPPFLRGAPPTLRLVWRGADVPDDAIAV
jgi:inner membrane transporter RhtA